MTTEPAPIEGVEKTNTVIIRGQEQRMGAPRRDPYVMEVDKGRNCYACGEFGHMACHCRNQRRGMVANRRRLEYGGWNIKRNHELVNHLKEEENLESLN